MLIALALREELLECAYVNTHTAIHTGIAYASGL